MNTLYSLILVIYAQVSGPMPENYHPPAIDQVEMKTELDEDTCVYMMLEIQDKISPEANIEYVCRSETVDSNGFIKTIYPN
ncbi:hypothetical protein BRC2024_KCUCJSVR_CDS_0018 [Acinetobacter phage vB_AbaM_KissB]